MYPIYNQINASHQIRPPRAITLAAGQLFQGRILKIFPNQIASLSMNGMQVTARLEAALTAGQRYWFEVKDATGLPRLRVLDDNSIRREGRYDNISTERLMQQLGLPSSKAMEGFVQQLTASKLPFSRETLLTGFHLLTEIQTLNEKGYQTVASLIEKQIAISKETFFALRAMENQASLTTQLKQLSDSLASFNHGSAFRVKELIETLLRPGTVQTTQSPILQLLTLQLEENKGANQILARLGIVKEGTSREQIDKQLKHGIVQPANKQIVNKLWPELLTKNNQSFQAEALLAKLQIPSGQEGLNQLGQLFQLLNVSVQPEQVHSNWLQLPTTSLAKEERQVLQHVLQSTTKFQNEHQTAGTHLKTIMTMLGLQYEHDMRRMFQGEYIRDSLQSDRLKAQLMIIQQQDLPLNIKEQVNQLLSHLTGQQLLLHEQNGSFHQILFQLPVSLGNYQTELTMQWEGKKKETGELDSSYCRVLFYLTLERLQETVVDMQIQNRIVTITIFNDQDKPQALFDFLMPSLKQALIKQDYQLSSVTWKKISEQAQNKTPSFYKEKVNYQGVDIRI
jgi:hypothetical protein